MAKDYAAKYKRVSKRNNSNTNKWKWLVICIVIALILIGWWIYFGKIHHAYKNEDFKVLSKEIENSNKAVKEKEKEIVKSVDIIESNVVGEPQFDFYTILPKDSVNIAQKKSTHQSNSNGYTQSISRINDVTSVMQKNVYEELGVSEKSIIERSKKYQYFLQIAAVKNILDANIRKDELVLLGFKANIKEFRSKGSTWYRIVIGPYYSESKMKEDRLQLGANKISSIVVKL